MHTSTTRSALVRGRFVGHEEEADFGGIETLTPVCEEELIWSCHVQRLPRTSKAGPIYSVRCAATRRLGPESHANSKLKFIAVTRARAAQVLSVFFGPR